MSEAKFEYFKLKLVEPAFDSTLTDSIIALDHLRKKKLFGSTIPMVFFQLKELFHMLESISSARIEGNNTTIAEYIETKIEEKENVPQGIKEIQNLEKAMDFIEKNIKENGINKMFISELHKMVVADLLPPPKGEGDLTPGEYRKNNLRINKSNHLPPDYVKVEEYMNELFDFIHETASPKYDLLKVAIAHHRFMWIHPFGNGNGRTGRLFTYAMLIKLGFNVSVGRILNPTAVFCNDRDNYYENLSHADKGTDQGVLLWCEYVLKGLREEIEKIDRLLDYGFLTKEILLPTISYSLERKYITELESKVLKRVIEKQVIQAHDLKDIYSDKVSSEISRQIRKLVNKKMLIPIKEGSRRYIIHFENNYLLRGMMQSLGEKGFLPVKE